MRRYLTVFFVVVGLAGPAIVESQTLTTTDTPTFTATCTSTNTVVFTPTLTDTPTFTATPIPPPYALSPGDIAFTGFSDDTSGTNPSQYMFVILKAISADTPIWFTDHNWNTLRFDESAYSLQSSQNDPREGTNLWVAGDDYPAGTQVIIGPGLTDVVISSQGVTLAPGTVSDVEGNGALDLQYTYASPPYNQPSGPGQQGDQLFAFQGSMVPNQNCLGSVTFLAAVNTGENWSTSVDFGSSSLTNTGLVDGDTCWHTNGYTTYNYYDCTKSGVLAGSVTQLRAAISNNANHTTSPGPNYSFPLCGLVIGTPILATVTATPTATPTTTPTLTPIYSYTPTPTQVPLALGDVAFVALAARSTVNDQFAWVILKSVNPGTQVIFTDQDWSNSSGSFAGGENTVTWTADQLYPAGSVGEVFNDGSVTIFPPTGGAYPGTMTGETIGMSKNGDNLFAITGATYAPNFLCGLIFKLNWGDTDDNGRTEDFPPQLASGGVTYAVSLGGGSSYGWYNCANGATGSRAQLDALFFDPSKWESLSDNKNTDLPQGGDILSCAVSVTGPPPTATPTRTATSTPTPTGTLTPLVTLTSTEDPVSRVMLGPVPINSGGDLCLYAPKTVQSAHWQVFNLVGDRIANLSFGPGNECWNTAKTAPGLYFIKLDIAYSDGTTGGELRKVIITKGD